MGNAKRIIDLDAWSEKRRCRVRYGRSRLTIARWGSILLSETAEALSAHRRGEIAADEVAWTFIRARVEDHSPSFHWDEAELGRMIALVIACSDQPKLHVTNATDLVAELELVEGDERKQLERAQEKFRKSMRALTVDWSNAFRPPTLSPQLFKQMQSPAFKPPPTLSVQVRKEIQAAQPGLLLARSLNDQFATMRIGLQAMNRTVAIPRLESLRVDTPLWNSVGRLIDSYRVQPLFSAHLINSMASSARGHDLVRLTEDLLEANLDVKQDEAADALRVTAEVLRSDLTADEMADAFARKITPLFDDLGAKIEASQPTLAEKVFLLLVAAVMTLAMQPMLVHVGVPLEPPVTEQSQSEVRPGSEGSNPPRHGHEPKPAKQSATTAKEQLRREVENLSEDQASRVLSSVQQKTRDKAVGQEIADGYRRIPQTSDEDAWSNKNAREAIREERW